MSRRIELNTKLEFVLLLPRTQDNKRAVRSTLISLIRLQNELIRIIGEKRGEKFCTLLRSVVKQFVNLLACVFFTEFFSLNR